MENTWQIDIRKGWIVGLALAVVLIATTVGLVAAALVRPVSIEVFLMGVAACISLGLAIRIIYQLWGLINARYELDRNALTIYWGPVEHQIPMGAVREVLSGAKLEDLHIRPSLRWPGYLVALGRAWRGKKQEREKIDPLLFYGTKRAKDHVVIRTEGVAYAISPSDTEGFLVALRERLEMGPTQEVEERSRHPAFLDWKIWRDRWGLGMLIAGAAMLVLLVGVLCWRYPYLPDQVALRFNPDGTPLLVAGTPRIFYLAILGTAFVVVNGGLGLFFYHRERPLSYFLWSGLVAIMGSLWAAVISILTMQ